MNELTRSVTVAGLLHDIGKVLHRANVDGRAHSISGWEWVKNFTDDQIVLDCIRYHHHQEIAEAALTKDHPGYIVYLADNISSGADRREVEGKVSGGFDKNRSLEAVYNLLNNAHGEAVYKVAAVQSKINYPREPGAGSLEADYKRIFYGLEEGLRGTDFRDEYINSLLELCEAYLSYIPSSTYRGEVADISLFDHSKITAALAACIALYLSDQGRVDFEQDLFQNRQQFYQEKAFCLFSCDISGIQSFIYNISSKGALKGLRSRSFYLELLLENLVDEILSSCFLYRTNLLYTGGGHAYLLLPNTPTAKGSAAEAVNNINKKLLELFGSRLFVAYGLQECSAKELMNNTEDPEAYSNIFRSVAMQVSERKLRRYSAAQLRQLNSQPTDQEGRECKVCGVSAQLIERDEEVFCPICASFNDISRLLITPDTVLTVTSQELTGPALPLFSHRGDPQYAYALPVDEVRKLLQNGSAEIVRLYSKNTFRTGFTLATKLWLGDYAITNTKGDLKTFAELAASSTGINRIGVLRADVDNMGSAFIKGFIRDNAGADKYRYHTLSRTTTLSRNLSIFFKYYLNDLLANGVYDLLAPQGPRNVVIVYAGGDDLFLVGAWNEVLAAALDIRRAFTAYTGQTLTMSAGLAIFTSGYPIARMAAETAQLEESAKKYEHQGSSKNAISLFGLEYVAPPIKSAGPVEQSDGDNQPESWQLQAMHTYDWDTFENQVLGEKFALLDSLFSDDHGYGNSFLYSIMYLLRQAQPDGMNIARLAYLLARREPDRRAAEEVKARYQTFTENIYRWALHEEDRRQLITAIMLYVYNNREEKEDRTYEW